jgi:formate-dependent nitrite reductase cytochrome c552 subunit
VRLARALLLAALAAFCISLAWPQQPAAPEQPIPFSHKTHAGNLKLQCKMCHPNPDPGESMTIAAPAACMQCHSAIKTDSPAIQKLAAFAKNGREIRWARIYELPSYVRFSHRTHLTAGAKCADCHGPVETRDALYKEGDISMGGCMNCHRQKSVSIDCTFCHDQLN